jgi:hypothetical protein
LLFAVAKSKILILHKQQQLQHNNNNIVRENEEEEEITNISQRKRKTLYVKLWPKFETKF